MCVYVCVCARVSWTRKPLQSNCPTKKLDIHTKTESRLTDHHAMIFVLVLRAKAKQVGLVGIGL